MIVESIGDVIKLSGDLTSNQWEAIRTAAGLLLRRHPRGVVVDCGSLTSCTEEGAQTFYDMMRHIESKQARIIVADVPPAVREVFKHVPEVRSRLAVAESVEEARSSLDLLDSLTRKPEPQRHSTGKLILALCGGPADSYAVALASAVAQMRKLTVVAVYPIVVPQALPATTPRPEQEAIAERTLQTATEAFKAKDVPVELVIERTRSIAAAVEKLSEQLDERTAIIALPETDARTGEPAKTAEELLAKLSPEVILVRQPKK